jgi:hypothetical protein
VLVHVGHKLAENLAGDHAADQREAAQVHERMLGAQLVVPWMKKIKIII